MLQAVHCTQDHTPLFQRRTRCAKIIKTVQKSFTHTLNGKALPFLEIPSWLGHRLLAPITTRDSTMSPIRINGPASHISHLLRMRSLRIIPPPHRREPVLFPLRLGRRQEIDDEAPDVEDVNERDDPLEDGADVVVFVELRDGEDDGERDLDQDEGEFEPEGDAEDAVFAVVDPEALVFGADEDGADYVAEAGRCVSVCGVWKGLEGMRT